MNFKEEFKANYINKYFSSNFVMSGDTLSVILKAHLLVEYLLDCLLTAVFKTNKILDERDFTFNLKVSTVEAVALISSDLLISIKRLNSVRNKFAHDIDTNFDTIDITDVFTCFQSCVPDFEPLWNQANRIQKFGLTMIYLLSKLSTIIEENIEQRKK